MFFCVVNEPPPPPIMRPLRWYVAAIIHFSPYFYGAAVCRFGGLGNPCDRQSLSSVSCLHINGLHRVTSPLHLHQQTPDLYPLVMLSTFQPAWGVEENTPEQGIGRITIRESSSFGAKERIELSKCLLYHCIIN